MRTNDNAAGEVGRGFGGRLTIDVGAIVDNWRGIAALAGSAETGAVVKADCYGLGAETIVPRLLEAGCRTFFVALLGEALALRPLLPPGVAIYVLNGVEPGSERVYADAGIRPVLSSFPQARAWGRLASAGVRLPPAALQVDSGMSRLGLDVAEQQALAADRPLLSSLGLDLLVSHLANADEPSHPGNAGQRAAFAAAAARFPGLRRSLAATAGVVLGKDYAVDLVRPGASLYGIRSGAPIPGIRPVVDLRVPLAQVRSIAPGTSVGYGYTFTAERPMRIGTVGAGYADGWRRALAGKGFAWLGEHRLPILGRISMDSFSVDLSAVPEDLAVEGALVELIGPHQSADDVAALAGTIGYEILTSLGPRYARHYR